MSSQTTKITTARKRRYDLFVVSCFRGFVGRRLKSHFHSKLNLPRIEDVARRAEAEGRRRRRVRVVDAAPDGVDVFHVHAIEEVEDVERQLGARATVHADVAADAEIDARI